MYAPQRFPPDLQYAATLPCEIQKSKSVTEFSQWTRCICGEFSYESVKEFWKSVHVC